MVREAKRHTAHMEEQLVRDLQPLKMQIKTLEHICQNFERKQQTYVFLWFKPYLHALSLTTNHSTVLKMYCTLHRYAYNLILYCEENKKVADDKIR